MSWFFSFYQFTIQFCGCRRIGTDLDFNLDRAIGVFSCEAAGTILVFDFAYGLAAGGESFLNFIKFRCSLFME